MKTKEETLNKTGVSQVVKEKAVETKLPYHPPALRSYGSMRELTKGAQGFVPDGVGGSTTGAEG